MNTRERKLKEKGRRYLEDREKINKITKVSQMMEKKMTIKNMINDENRKVYKRIEKEHDEVREFDTKKVTMKRTEDERRTRYKKKVEEGEYL